MIDVNLLTAAMRGSVKYRRPSSYDKHVRSGTGATISVRELIIATVDEETAGCFRFNAERSFALSLEDRTQSEVSRFAVDLQTWLSRLGIDRMTLRGSNIDGLKRPSGYTYKLETVLQMMPSLQLQIVHANKIRSWITNDRFKLINVPSGSSLAAAKLHAAMEAAAYAACSGNDYPFEWGGRHA